MHASARLRVYLPILALLLALACSLTPAGPTPVPVRTLGPVNQYLGPTLPAVGAYRPSPAGWIAFVRDGNVWLIHPDGSGAKQVTQDAVPGDIRLAWSTDGQLLAYSQGGTLTVMSLLGLGRSVIARDTSGGFDWSATAHQLLYDTALTSSTGSQAANSGLRVVTSDGSTTRALNAAGFPVMLDPLWSFDSKSVLFAAPGSTSPHLLDAATGVVTDLLPGASPDASCRWSTVELIIACLDGNPPASATPTVILFDQSGKEQRRIALPSGHEHARLGPWSPDGGSLALTYSTGPDGYGESSDILSIDTGEFKKVSSGRLASWSPDARWVVMEGASADSQALMVVNTTSGAASPLADGSSPAWQPAADDSLLAATGGTPVPGTTDYCLDASSGFVHKKPLGHYLMFCIGAQKYNYGALAGGVYIVGPQTRYFVYASNSGFAYAGRMGDPTLTRIGDFRWFRIFHVVGEPDPRLSLRFVPGYPALVQVIESTFTQKDTFTMPHRIFAP